MKILVVDDSPVMRHYVARILEMTGLGATIHEAGDGREGISIALEVRPDLVITDLSMPNMGGAELVAAMHVSPELKDTPVLVLTADRSSVRPDELMKAGASGYLIKPITPQSLRHRLVSLLGVAQ